jgi:hypothetical protein
MIHDPVRSAVIAKARWCALSVKSARAIPVEGVREKSGHASLKPTVNVVIVLARAILGQRAHNFRWNVALPHIGKW